MAGAVYYVVAILWFCHIDDLSQKDYMYLTPPHHLILALIHQT